MAVIVAGAQADIGARRTALGHPLLLRLGDVSFAFYLVHAQMIHLAGALLPRTFHYQTSARALGLWLAEFETSLALAFALRRLVELPAQRRLRAHRTAPGVVAGSVASVH
jgi:peptidoglycan/LPS O-acetylase OafA/YrhL